MRKLIAGLVMAGMLAGSAGYVVGLNNHPQYERQALTVYAGRVGGQLNPLLTAGWEVEHVDALPADEVVTYLLRRPKG